MSVEEAILLQSENLYMRLKIEQLQFELECEQKRSRHFEGISQIALLELRNGSWANGREKRERISKALKEIEMIKIEMGNSVSKIEKLVIFLREALEIC